jgi:hypothetical protein
MLIDNVLGQLKWSLALVSLDDIVVFSRYFAEHLSHLELVFTALQTANLKLKPRKCTFADSKLKFRGHIISAKGVEVNPVTTQAVVDFSLPKRVKDI